MDVTVHPSHMTLNYYAQTQGTRLHNCIDGSTELGSLYRPGLYKDAGTAHEARLLDPQHAVLTNTVTTLTMPLCANDFDAATMEMNKQENREHIWNKLLTFIAVNYLRSDTSAHPMVDGGRCRLFSTITASQRARLIYHANTLESRTAVCPLLRAAKMISAHVESPSECI